MLLPIDHDYGTLVNTDEVAACGLAFTRDIPKKDRKQAEENPEPFKRWYIWVTLKSGHSIAGMSLGYGPEAKKLGEEMLVSIINAVEGGN
jgi:hypothetical protein